MEEPPPRWVRRFFIAPVVLVLAIMFTLASPVLHLFAAILDLIFDRKRFRLSRFIGIGLAFCVCEVFGLLTLLSVWIGSLFGRYMNRPVWVKANVVLTGQYLELLTRAVRFFLGFDFAYGYEPVDRRGAQLVLPRHAGPGDAFLLMRLFIRDLHRPIHAIGAAKLQWDPFLDIMGDRLGHHFLLQNPADTMAELEKITALAASLGDDESLLIFPEGGNFTPGRRQDQIDKLTARGRDDYLAQAERLNHTLLPKSGGVQAALAGKPDATVIFASHAGLDGLHGFGDLWDAVPLGRKVVAHGWSVPTDDYPEDRHGQAMWLFEHWQKVDDWVEDHIDETGAPRPSHDLPVDFDLRDAAPADERTPQIP